MKRIIVFIVIAMMIFAAGCGVGQPPAGELDIDAASKIAMGGDFFAAVKGDGKVISCGQNDKEQCNTKKWADICGVAAGARHTLGLKKDGTVIAVGENRYGQCDVTQWKNVSQIAAGSLRSFALFDDGTIATTAAKDEMDVSAWEDIVAIASSSNVQDVAGLRVDGSVVASFEDEKIQEQIKGWENIKQLSVGLFYIVGLKEDGTVVAAGSNKDGRSNVEKWEDIEQISAGAYRTLGIKKDGTVIITEPTAEYYEVADFADVSDVVKWRDIVAVQESANLIVGLKSDGTLVFAGDMSDPRVKASSW
ncbi:MAG: hypothetical protein RR514_07985, partial [Christensenella sp.]